MTSSSRESEHAADLRMAALGRVGFVGAGAVASTLARALHEKGASVAAVTSRSSVTAGALAKLLPGCLNVASPSEVAARADTVFLAVPDDAIAPVAQSIPWRADQVAVHLSGARGLDPLASAATRGASIAALHPLMTFPASLRDQPIADVLARFAGCVWALEAGDPALAATLEGMVGALGGKVVALSAEQRVPYHLSAVLASNYIVALLGAAVHLWQDFGVAPDEALAALLPLTRAAVEGLASAGLPAALTGPIARGDVGTVEAHLAWLRAQLPADLDLAPLADAYVALARLALPLALAKGSLSPKAAAALRTLLASLGMPSDPSSESS